MRKLCFVFPLIFLLVVIVFQIFPVLIGSVWHLFNGKATSYEGWSIPVPEGFFAFRRHGSLFIARIEPGFGSHAGRFNIVVVSNVPASHSLEFNKDFSKFREIESASASRKGLTESVARTIHGRDGPRYCVEFGRADSERPLRGAPEGEIKCFIEGESTVLSYTGKQVFAPNVYSILQNMIKIPG